MKSSSKDLCKYFCRKCQNFIYYNEACELIYKKIYPDYYKVYYNKYEFDKKTEGKKEVNQKQYDNLYRQLYNNGLCGVNKQRNDFLNKDNINNILLFLNKGSIQCNKCNNIHMWYMK
ncbi:hypothetical protein PGSY75_1106400 [Plasmodium gaboni]|uniref:Uncharacterized protein n=1 Tax=Plasmodium gaboni TaxID=647221 RepID=A0A151LIJ0_9APIC|nr:hypothetical protein PGSY75_1106400 [Plasmodium gaboni]KYN98707.1 hypothetical protein PGSY75_1106400 [Plasmodium gaboni]SOV15322.1 conserved Plasmodium protein, unknown function [Plasmodium gaboni]SOV23148.1 conserved Plasmodium protein, unknown function [Plasmodium sp. DRC-Itaito]